MQRALSAILAAAVVLHAASAAAVPELRWAQSKAKVFVTLVNAQCGSAAFGADTLAADCGEKGQVRPAACTLCSRRRWDVGGQQERRAPPHAGGRH